ncbi:hypothetical protein IC229_02965 [Spirosoma sp. BT702]|uniref:Uncharacterized protein n=1 Tax=Spirosoma profusum TaxID=2771354 RepID=A0A927AT90_9BACT|nr:hypothetical protein [Spirosoma profusum]MBD2699582.1 hypothetical protein [Spirosoma profusum]
MNNIRSFRSFLTYGVLVLIILIVLFETISWIYAYEAKLAILSRSGGLFAYAGLLIRNSLLPEMVTVFILSLLTYYMSRWLKIELIDSTWSTIARYELSFLPVMLLAFVIFNPFTESVRYLLTEFPDYSFANYWDKYIIGTYSWKFYFRYLAPVMFIGYSTLTISLLVNTLTDKGPAVLR